MGIIQERGRRIGPFAGSVYGGYNEPMAWDMIGHTWATGFLEEQLAQGSLHHAYLFTGPDGVGKGTLGLRLAQAVLCTESGAGPCRECRACKRVARRAHPDLHVLEAESTAGTLKVDQVREMRRQVSLAPYEGGSHVVLLLRCHEMSREAANALLKTLEEPPAKVLLILTARSAEALLPTLVSRCEVMPLRPVPQSELVAGLQRHFPEDKAELLGALAAGRPGIALSLAEDEGALEVREEDLGALYDAIGSDRIDRFRLAAEWAPNRDRSAEKRRILRALETWLSLWRDVLLRAFGARVPLGNPDQRERVEKMAGSLAPGKAAAATEAIADAMGGILRNANLQLSLEALLLDLPYLEWTGD